MVCISHEKFAHEETQLLTRPTRTSRLVQEKKTSVQERRTTTK